MPASEHAYISTMEQMTIPQLRSEQLRVQKTLQDVQALQLPAEMTSALQMRQNAIGLMLESRKPSVQRLAESLRQAKLATQAKAKAANQFAALQEQLSAASITLREAQEQEAHHLAQVQRIRQEISELSSPAPSPPTATPQAITESFMAHAPSLAHLDGPTQEVLRLAISHGYNCACHGAAAPALPPTELNLPTPALVHTLTQSPALNIHSAASTDVAPAAHNLGPAAILAAHETA
eukprot:3173261-Amphidinium_carterae.1